MTTLRSVLSVFVGYLVFAIPSFAFFFLSGQPPHQPAPVPIMLASMVVGVISACLGGYVAAFLAGRAPMGHGVATGLLLAAFAAASLWSTIGKGAIWSQIAALVLMAPSAVAGGWARRRQRRSAVDAVGTNPAL